MPFSSACFAPRDRLLQRRDVRPGEHFVDPVELRVIPHLLRRMLALEKVQRVPQLTPAEAGRRLAGDVPSVEEVERRLGHGAEQRIPVPHDGPVPEPAHLVRLAVVHDHDHRGARRRQHDVGKEEVDGGAQVRLRRRLGLPLPLLRRRRRRRRLGLLGLALLSAESYGLDHFRLAVAVLQGPRGLSANSSRRRLCSPHLRALKRPFKTSPRGYRR